MPCYKPLSLPRKNSKRGFLIVPCSRCIGCRLERRRQWAQRCVNEASMHKENCFITLTYRESELPHGFSGPILVARDLELFFKRLRYEVGNGIKYFACGEYGERYHRPHYHACIFGHDFKDKVVDSVTEAGYTLYNSPMLDYIWRYGRTIIGDFSFDTASYVAGYLTDGKDGIISKFDEDLGIPPEFVRMSRRPGLGASWYDKYKSDIFPSGSLVLNGVKCRPPRYYIDRLGKQDSVEAEIQSLRRNFAAENRFWYEYDMGAPKLSAKERVKKAQIKSLTRDDF